MRFWTAILAGLMMTLPAGAQAGDPNLRHPGIVVVDGEDGESQFVVGDAAWGDVLATLAALRSADPAQGQTIADQLWQRRDINPPLFLFEVARLTVETDPDRALEAYFLGRSRAIYDAARCIDSTALTVVHAASEQAGPAVTELMARDLDRMEAALVRVIESGEAFTSQASPWWACSYGNAAYYAAVNDAAMPGAEWLRVEGVWPNLRSALSNNMNTNLAVIREGRAANPQ